MNDLLPEEQAELDHRREAAYEATVIYLHHLAVSLVPNGATEADAERAFTRLLRQHGWEHVLLMFEPLGHLPRNG